MTTRAAILGRVRAMPALPAATGRLVPLLQDPDADPDEVCRWITHDPALTSYVLRVANSAALGPGGEVKSMRQALMRLGTSRVLAAVLGAGVGRLARRPVRGYNLRPGSLWESSVAVALATEAFARVRGHGVPMEAFTAGLLCDVGKLVLGEFVQRESGAIGRLAFGSGLSFERAEREVLGLDHAEAGAELLAAWGLPASIVQVVRWHHEPERAPEEHRDVTDLVHLATYTCTLSGLGGGDDGTNYVPCDATMQRLGLSSAEVEEGMCLTVLKLDEVRELFGLKTGSR